MRLCTSITAKTRGKQCNKRPENAVRGFPAASRKRRSGGGEVEGDSTDIGGGLASQMNH